VNIGLFETFGTFGVAISSRNVVLGLRKLKEKELLWLR
jgi:hypothetical protein